MGKNTMMKRSIRLYCERSGNKSWEAVLDHLQGNVGLLFTKSDLNEIKAELKKFVVGAPARVGAIAPCDVFVPPGGTGMDPSQTSFFQALGIATKINRGTIEILNQVHLVQEGTKVGGSEATLLAKLGIKPFEYGLKIMQVYENGSLYAPEVLDITDEMLLSKAEVAIRNIASLCLGANYPTIVSLPHSIINAYKNVLAIAVETDYTFPLAEKVGVGVALICSTSNFSLAMVLVVPVCCLLRGECVPCGETIFNTCTESSLLFRPAQSSRKYAASLLTNLYAPWPPHWLCCLDTWYCDGTMMGLCCVLIHPTHNIRPLLG
ncbi:unnamed protein product [Ostreobium quekettii]|uniref:Large ribosomal subunit protein uL10-like insertion domain-containing protein n=1 Tax=Ostreobium quekettii TaxID=121088 RepID=A0A8S1JDT9_9CHLO|nr:unnamed protein product [Ostreobium quekettii]